MESSNYIGNTSVRLSSTPGRGRGVFANRDFEPGEIIEKMSVVTFNEKERDLIDQTTFTNYWFSWKLDEDPNEYGALAGGDGLFFNHSKYHNARHTKDFENKMLVVTAIRPIKKDEEITLKYHTLWFEAEDPEEKPPEWVPGHLQELNVDFNDFN